MLNNKVSLNNSQEAVGDTLEELWISYNAIEKLKGIHVLKKLKVVNCFISFIFVKFTQKNVKV